MAEELTRIQREDSSRLLAALVRRFGDIDLAEDVAQDSITAALETWSRSGVPEAPLAWLMTTAKRKAIDRLRRDAVHAQRLAELRIEEELRPTHTAAPDQIPDERLELFFACCHPTLRPDEQVALTLRFLGGLTTVEIAAAFLVPVATMQARLTRAKKRIRVTRIPIAVPDAEHLPERLPVVLQVIYSIFTEGYAATTADAHLRPELTVEAIRLARLVLHLLPGHSEVKGLLSLLLLTEARAPARTDEAGLPVPLADQDRRLWSQPLLKEGLALAQESAREAGSSGGPGPHVIRAAIAAVHAEATEFGGTDWAQVVALYDLLFAVAPSPVVALNRAIAIGRLDGFQVGLRLLDELGGMPELQRHHPYHAARAVTLEELGRDAEAVAAWEAAADCATNPRELTYVKKRASKGA